MSNVTIQEALKAAIEAFELHAKQYPHMVKGYCIDALEDCKAALSDIEKCEPVAYMDEFGNIVSAKWEELYGDGTIYKIPIYTSPQPRELYAGDCVAYLYKDNNGGLKICNESPPPDKSFPVFISNISFLDVARTVLDDCSDLIIKHGGVNLWKELIAKINRDYKQLNTKG